MVVSKYRLAILIPETANRALSEDGWQFESDFRLPNEIEELLNDNGFSFIEENVGIYTYKFENIEAGVYKDDEGAIEFIDFRFYGSVPKIPVFLEESKYMTNLEFFIP